MKSLFVEMKQNGYEELQAEQIYAQRVTFKESKKKYCKTLFYIQQNVNADHFENISKATRSKEI